MRKSLPKSVEAMMEAGGASHAPTAPLAEFFAAYEEDDNLWWRVGCGHHMNLFDAAMEEIDRLKLQLKTAREALERGDRVNRDLLAQLAGGRDNSL